MSYYEDDFYYPSEFETLINEFKQSLKDSVKEDILNEIEKLRKENAELQSVKNEWHKLKIEHRNKISELNREKENLRKEVRKEHLSKIMDDLKHTVYKIKVEQLRGDKCDKCDTYRKVIYTTPLGREAKEDCKCAEYKIVYKIKEAYLFSFADNINGRVPLYLLNYNTFGSKFELYDFDDDDLMECRNLVKTEEELENLKSIYETFFISEELANKYIEILNSESN